MLVFNGLEKRGAVGRIAPRRETLGEHGDQITPSKRPRSPFDDIVIVAAPPGLGACTGAFESSVEDRFGERAHRFPNGAVLFHVDEVAYAVTHLAFGFLDEKGFGGPHKGGAGLDGDGFDVASDKCVVGSSDDGFHILSCLWFDFVHLSVCKDMTFIQYMQIIYDFF